MLRSVRGGPESGAGLSDPSADSIAKDFTNAQTWLVLNDKDLRSIWTALQGELALPSDISFSFLTSLAAADKLQDLDDRLTKAFASKMSVAIFSALQDSREATTKIQTTLDGMQESLEVAVREASREGLHAAIQVLKEEAYQARGGGGATPGFHNGEAEKIISQVRSTLASHVGPRYSSCSWINSSSTNFRHKSFFARKRTLVRSSTLAILLSIPTSSTIEPTPLHIPTCPPLIVPSHLEARTPPTPSSVASKEVEVEGA